MYRFIFSNQEKRKNAERASSLLASRAALAQGGSAAADSHSLAGAAQQQQHAVSPRAAAASRTPNSCSSPRAQRKATLPAFQALLGGGRSPARQRLPHVQPVGDSPAPTYCSMEGLRKLADLHKSKHSTVGSYLDTRTNHMVAIKTYYKRTMAKRHFRNVRREISISRLLAKQRFTGAVQLLGAFEDESHIYLVQESCGGGDLYRRLVRAGGTLPEADVARDVVVPLLLTLTFLHASHIVHRDIKPENIFFAADGGLRLGDFGLSIDARVERPTSRVGTLDYMAPEVVGMPSPDDIQRLGLSPHEVGHYSCKVDVWAVGILAYELICGRPPFEVEDMKLTESHIKFSEVAFPPHVSPLCRAFIQQALTKRPESRPSAAQLFQHPWVQTHYRQLLAGQAAGVAAAADAAAQTPELRRTVSQPPSPSKSMPEGHGSQGAASSMLSPVEGAAAMLAPFLPLSQAKMAHKVRLLSPGGTPGSQVAVRRRRRMSDPLARVRHQQQMEQQQAAGSSAAADVPPSTPPPPTAAPTCSGDHAEVVAAEVTAAAAAATHDSGDDDSSSGGGLAQGWETPGTPGLKTTPLHRQRPVVQQQQQRALGRTPFLLPLLTPGGGAGAAASDVQPVGAGVRKAAAPGRSRFASAAENDEMQAAAAAPPGSSTAQEAGDAASPASMHARSRSFSHNSFSAFSGGGGSSGNLAALQGRANSFTSAAGNGSNGNLQVQGRASSFTSFGGSSSNLSNISGMGRKLSSKLLLAEGQEAAGTAGEQQQPAAGVEETLQRLQLQ